jgi:regulator of sigma E protease
LITVLSFLVALGILIAVHEWGHYRAALACGVHVERFSLGFGPVIFKRINARGTEFALSALPLGGYVKMLDARDGPVSPVDSHRAFSSKRVSQRAFIVAAGPLANFVLAVALYSVINWAGQQAPKAIIAQPLAQSIAANAGLSAKDEVLAHRAIDGSGDEVDSRGEAQAVLSFDDLIWVLSKAALASKDLELQVRGANGSERWVTVPTSRTDVRVADAQLVRQIGVVAPFMTPLLSNIDAAGAAAAAGLKNGDIVLAVNGQPVSDAQMLREWIRANPGAAGSWRIDRAGQSLDVSVTPKSVEDAQGLAKIGRVGAALGDSPQSITVRQGPVDGVVMAVERVWDVSALSLRMLGKMLVGEASIKNLSGPLTIADYAGKSAVAGWIAFLGFLALISVSLGVLNLLPLPVLDGGHLMYYLWEAVTGREVSAAWLEKFQRAGVGALVLLMCVAFYNDVVRLWG